LNPHYLVQSKICCFLKGETMLSNINELQNMKKTVKNFWYVNSTLGTEKIALFDVLYRTKKIYLDIVVIYTANYRYIPC
jgi:hypothetical protein